MRAKLGRLASFFFSSFLGTDSAWNDDTFFFLAGTGAGLGFWICTGLGAGLGAVLGLGCNLGSDTGAGTGTGAGLFFRALPTAPATAPALAATELLLVDGVVVAADALGDDAVDDTLLTVEVTAVELLADDVELLATVDEEVELLVVVELLAAVVALPAGGQS